MFQLTLIDIGPSRLRVIRALATALKITISEAKRIVDHEPSRLAVGDAMKIAYVRRMLKESGASVDCSYCPEEMRLKSWVDSSMSADGTTCARCGASLFFAVPAMTTDEQVVAFGKACRLPGSEEIVSDRWIHPGVYCPNGCCFVMVNLDHPDKYTGLVPPP